ncbi:MAG: hypothetical protein IPG94_05345 [Kineosporiaceae bacterium]|nr:hypothetical protein [Kineosporiaceae bacterium]
MIPDDDSLFLRLECEQYRKTWHAHQRKLLAGFESVTGLTFQQRFITARVTQSQVSTAGRPGVPMRLAGDYRSAEFKLMTLVHELSHRLLGGNTLGPVGLGLDTGEGAQTDWGVEIEHRHIYLFEWDVVRHALGDEWAEVCRVYETGGQQEPKATPHGRAWHWAMTRSADERQKAVRRLVAQAVTRNDWSSLPDQVEPRDPDTWFAYLLA